jgi:ArsR family transcriptional regulator, arsenate/arsenite/antimonite-responsive transcriptional repressor
MLLFRHLAKSLNASALTRTFQALTDPTRREILRLLADGDLNAGQIASNFHISLPSVSHHLSVLKNADLVSAERDGQSIVYSLNASVAQEALQLLLDLTGAGKPATKARVRRVTK